MSTGIGIFLNGTSSAGKTTLARALQRRLDVPFQHMALDQFRDGLADQYRGLNAPPGTTGAEGLNVVPVDRASTRIQFGEAGERMLRGMRRAMAAMMRAGNHIVIDDIIMSDAFLQDYLWVFEGLDLYFVGVRCSKQQIEARESRRPGRFPGTASGQLDICHAHGCYDIEVDTSVLSPDACATRIITAMGSPPAAFNRLRERRRQANPSASPSPSPSPARK